MTGACRYDATAVATVAAPVLSAAEAAELGAPSLNRVTSPVRGMPSSMRTTGGTPSVPPIWAYCSNRREISRGGSRVSPRRPARRRQWGLNLGGLLAQQGDVPGAIAAFWRAAERGDSSAASNMGILLEHDGDLDGALAAYRKASEAGDADGSLNLGALLARTGDPTGAVSAYQKAIQHGDEELSRRARTALSSPSGKPVDASDHPREARLWERQAEDRRFPLQAPPQPPKPAAGGTE